MFSVNILTDYDTLEGAFSSLIMLMPLAHRFLSRQGSKLKREHEGMGPRSLIQRVTPYLVARIKENQRLLSSSATAYQEASSLSSSPSPSPSAPVDTIHMTDSCIRVFYTYILFCTYIWQMDSSSISLLSSGLVLDFLDYSLMVRHPGL